MPLREPPPPDPLERETAAARFKKLTRPIAPPKAGNWPASLLEDLPEDARKLLSRRPPAPGIKGMAQLREEMAKALRDQGYVLSEDAHGLRLSGAPVDRGIGAGRLSVSDVIRMASELGGELPADRRGRCPKCDAVIDTDAVRCQWCGELIRPPAG
jgi:hypothetical protein